MTSIRRDVSLRAKARENYRVAADHEQRAGARPLADPPPQAGEGTENARRGKREQNEGGEGIVTPYVVPTQLVLLERIARAEAALACDGPGQDAGLPSLTERVRALYENSAVPVREIARLIGVSDRTLYKYVQRGAWKRRYRLSRGPRNLPPRGAKTTGAMPRGAGGRLVRREDAGKPQASGLKALDPEGARRVAAACAVAAALSDRAQRAARRDLASRLLDAALADVKRLRRELDKRERAKGEEARGSHAGRLAERLHLVILGGMAGLDGG